MDCDMNFSAGLLWHIREGYTAEAKSMLQDLNPCELVDRSGSRLLHVAARCGNEGMTNYLISKGCDVNVVDHFGDTPLILAAKLGYLNVIDAILKANASNVLAANVHGDSAAKIIIRDLGTLDAPIMAMLLKKVKEECSNDSVLTAKKLLELRCLLPQAVCLRDTIVTEYLLQNGCGVDETSGRGDATTALHQAVGTSDVASVKLLVEYGADVNAVANCQFRCLHALDCEWHLEESTRILEILLSRNVSLTDHAGKYIVGRLLEDGNKDMVRLLMQCNLDLNQKDHSGSTLLHYISGNNVFDPAEELKDQRLDANATDDKGSTALMRAVLYNHRNTVEILLKKGARVNAVDERGNTALIDAFRSTYRAMNNHQIELSLKCVELLLEYGADAQWVNNDQNTLFDVAKTNKNFKPIKPVLAHLAMMEIRGCHIKHLIRSKINSYIMFKRYFDFSKRTVEKFQQTMIHQSVSLFTFLTESDKNINGFARIEHLISRLKLMMHSTRRSNLYYHKIFRKRATKVIDFANLRNKAFDILSQIRELNNNRIIMESIIDYFDYNDLQIIVLV